MALAVALTDPRYGLALKRNAAMDAIEDLITFLDETDGDPDVEENGDREPWLGWPNAGQRITDEMALADDREEDNADSEDGDAGEDNGDDEDGDPLEPMLGRPDFLMNQDQPLVGWTSHDDCEETNEDGGADFEEPWGSTMTWGEKLAVKAEAHRLLAGVQKQPRLLPDEVTIIAPGVAYVGAM